MTRDERRANALGEAPGDEDQVLEDARSEYGEHPAFGAARAAYLLHPQMGSRDEFWTAFERVQKEANGELPQPPSDLIGILTGD